MREYVRLLIHRGDQNDDVDAKKREESIKKRSLISRTGLDHGAEYAKVLYYCWNLNGSRFYERQHGSQNLWNKWERSITSALAYKNTYDCWNLHPTGNKFEELQKNIIKYCDTTRAESHCWSVYPQEYVRSLKPKHSRSEHSPATEQYHEW